MSWTEELPELPGIYKLTNLVNGKVYIGKSINLLGRIKTYLNDTENRVIQYAINKYGWDNFRKEAIEVFPHGVRNKLLLEREQFWIDFFQTLKFGYNEKEAFGHKDIKNFEYSTPNKAPLPKRGSGKISTVYQIDKDTGTIIKEWPSAKTASLVLSGKIHGVSAISGAARGTYKRKSWYGFHWKYGDGTHRAAQLRQLDKNTKEIVKEWPNAKDAANFLGVTVFAIYSAIRRKGTCCDFLWEKNNLV